MTSSGSFTSSCAQLPPRWPLHGDITRWWRWRALDVRHGLVLLRNLASPQFRELVVWDPITDKQWELPVLPGKTVCHTAVVLCGATATGVCDHRGCHRGPFRVVYVDTEPRKMFVSTYSSDVSAWSKPISIQRIEPCFSTYGSRRFSPSVLLGNKLYFGIPLTTAVLKYDLELHKKSWIQVPNPQSGLYSSMLTTMDDVELGLVCLQGGILCIWLRVDRPETDVGWTRFKVIDLGAQLNVVRPDFIDVVGFGDGIDIVFVTVNNALYTVDLKTYMVNKQVYNGIEMETIFPYMWFYTPDGRIGSQTKRKGSTSQKDEDPLNSQIKGYSGPNLPEDIWCYIHSLMPMRDAAKVACVSWAFVRSWKCHPDLHFSKETLGLDENACQKDGIADFNSRVDSILKKHSGIDLKAFSLDVHSVYDKDPCHLDRLDSLLQVVVKPGIEQLDLILTMYGNYNFPCSLLSDGTRGTLRYLSLASCRFHPTVRLGCLTSLTTLNLTFVDIKADELWCLLSSSPALERLELRHCDSIVCLKIPCLQQLNYLEVVCSSNCLRAIESKAPNLSSVKFVGDLRIPLSLENANCIKILDTHYYCSLAFYARADLPSVMPNLEALSIRSDGEVDTVPMVPSKFLHLKYLSLAIGGLTFDYLSLVSFLDAAPSLETFILEVIREFTKERVTVFNSPSDLRVIPGHHHSRLKRVKIIKFIAAKTVIELTCQILNSATSLVCLTLDTTNGHPGCSGSKTGKCVMMSKDALVKAHEGVVAAQTCIRPNVPPTVEFSLLEPCSRCQAIGF